MSRAPDPMIYDESGVVDGSAAIMTPERIKLAKGYYFRPTSDIFSKLWVLCRADGNVHSNGWLREDVMKFAAAMRPVQASPLLGDLEFATWLIDELWTKPVNERPYAPALAVHIARHREQATAPLHQALERIKREAELNPIDPYADKYSEGYTRGIHEQAITAREALAAHPTKAE